MNNNESLYSRTKKLFINSQNPENDIIKNTFNTHINYNNTPYFSNINTNISQNSYNNKSNIQMNNARINNINKSIRERKEKIENILSPIQPEIKKEEISHNEYQINNTMNQLNKIKTAYNINCLQVNNEFIQLNNKKNKLILVYNSLYNFKQKLLNREKDLKKREQKINKKETEIKMKESLIKNKFNSFNNYINYETENLFNKYKNLKNFHQQREDDLIIREEKIKEYEMIVKNIIQSKEKQNQEKIKECINLGNSIEKKIENEKEEQIVKDIEIIEKEKDNIEKEKEMLELEKEKIQNEKIENIKFRKINNNNTKKLKKKEIINNNNSKILNDKYPNFDKNINNTFNSLTREEYINNDSFFGKFYTAKTSNNKKKANYRKKLLTPIGLSYNSARYNIPIPFSFNTTKKKNKESSLLYDSIYNNNYSSIRFNEDSTSQNYHFNNSYIHDNIFLLKNKPNSNSKRFNKLIPLPSNTNSSRKNKYIKLENDSMNKITNRTMNLDIKNRINLNTTNESSLFGKEEESKSKYLEFKSDFDKNYSEINSKIYETEKGLQKIENQERKIKIIKEKLDKKSKGLS